MALINSRHFCLHCDARVTGQSLVELRCLIPVEYQVNTSPQSIGFRLVIPIVPADAVL